jgi:hypothetical protein
VGNRNRHCADPIFETGAKGEEVNWRTAHNRRRRVERRHRKRMHVRRWFTSFDLLAVSSRRAGESFVGLGRAIHRFADFSPDAADAFAYAAINVHQP